MPNLRALSKGGGDAGAPIGDSFRAFFEAGVQVRRGSVTLIGAGSGVGKSVLTLVMMLTALPRPLVQWHAMDSDPRSTCVRLVSSAAALHMDEAERQVVEHDRYAQQVLDAVDWIDFRFPASPDMEEVRDRVWAFAEVEGRWPEVVVVDNLMDIDFDGPDSEGQPWLVKQLEILARRTGAAVIILCHLMGEYESGDRPIPQSGFLYKIAKKATLALTLYHQGNRLMVSVVKNRWGRADPGGTGVRIPLLRDYSRMQITDIPEEGRGP